MSDTTVENEVQDVPVTNVVEEKRGKGRPVNHTVGFVMTPKFSRENKGDSELVLSVPYNNEDGERTIGTVVLSYANGNLVATIK